MLLEKSFGNIEVFESGAAQKKNFVAQMGFTTAKGGRAPKANYFLGIKNCRNSTK